MKMQSKLAQCSWPLPMFLAWYNVLYFFQFNVSVVSRWNWIWVKLFIFTFVLASPLPYSPFFDFRLGPNRESCLQWHGGATIIVIQLSCLAIHLSTLQRKSHLCLLSPHSHIHVSVSDLYIPRIGPHIFLQQNRQTDRWTMYKSLTDTDTWVWK